MNHVQCVVFLLQNVIVKEKITYVLCNFLVLKIENINVVEQTSSK